MCSLCAGDSRMIFFHRSLCTVPVLLCYSCVFSFFVALGCQSYRKMQLLRLLKIINNFCNQESSPLFCELKFTENFKNLVNKEVRRYYNIKGMHIQEVILEGFKTYINRTVISGFDPQFNAITGFNGSGKSNILDAIQFLLGSTNKEMLRLKNNLTQLIYKEGCSGIEKASVSIKFRCLDKSLRPTGYEANEELLVTRQITKDKVSKFFINGLASNLGKVKSLFRSVHLNIQNPHFLVKQGQITKIINLKPGELLGMIQETAGTAIYNKTKTQSEKMIKNKQSKLQSINQILKTSIVPQMDKLKLDRKRYTVFKQKETQLKNFNEQIKIYEFVTKRSLVQKKESEISHLRDQLEAKKIALQESTERLTELQGKIKILRNKGSTNVFAEFTEVSRALEQKRGQQRQLKKRIQKVQGDSYAIREEFQGYEEVIQRKKQDLEWRSKELINQEKQKDEFEALLREVNSSKGDQDARRILQKQINQQRDQIKEIQFEIKSMSSKLEMLKNEQIHDKKTRKQIEEAGGNTSKAIQQLEAEINRLETIQPPKQVQDPQITNNYLQRLEEDKKRLIGQNFQLRFVFNDPVPNFDRSKIKGKLFMLFKVRDRLHEKAIEIGAGGRLHNIVVENQVISKLVIERQTFGKSVSVIPNNKIRYKQLRHDAIAEARNIAKDLNGLAKPAYQLIQFDDQVRNSIMFAFSSFIICSTTEIAKRIAYHNRQELSCKCVTYDGDVFERGTLTGGHTNPNSLILNIYSELREIQNKIKDERKRFEVEKNSYLEYVAKLSQFKKIKSQIQLKTNRRQKLKTKLADLSYNNKKRNFAEEIEAINKRLKDLQSDVEIHRQKQNQLKGKVKKGGKSIEEQKKQILVQKKKQDKKVDDIKKLISMLEVEIESLSKKIEEARENDSKNQQQILKLENKLRAVNQEISNLQQDYEKKQEQKRNIQRDQAVSESKLQFLLNQESSLKNEQKKNESDVLALQRGLQSDQTLININHKEINKILEQCSWLESGKEYVIDRNFDYQAALREFKILTVDVDRLKKTAKITIDDHSYEKLVEQYNSLLEKRKILQNDKLTLLNNMHDLDDKRTKTLASCYSIVKQNLGKIFNDLLPGATAHLNLIDERDVTQGAELQVQFNKVKKQLSELSGGQRSLLALSFILALLLYKPSPFYILDEIDSALDLSHTENIGYMISQRFPQSQFIIISLKEGMFQNANVLYKVHFSEGESKVDRQVLKKK